LLIQTHLLIPVLALLTASCGLAAGTVFYVSPQGDDSWSGALPSPNEMGTDGPLRTVQAAQGKVREMVSGGLAEDLTVLVREGIYYLPHGLILTNEDSGTGEHSVTFAAYLGENVRLVGGTLLENWTRYRDEIWVAEIPDGSEPNQVFENGRRMDLARTPKMGYFEIEAPVQGKERTAFVYGETDLNPEGWDISDARVFIWPGHDWFSHEKAIASIDPANRTITMATDQGYDMIPGNRYFIKNVLALLQAPGECQIDGSEGLIYCWPEGGHVEDKDIVIPTADHVVTIRGTLEDPVRNVHVEGLDLTVCREDVVMVDGAENCSISSCLVENGGRNGVYVIHRSQGIEVEGNLIRENGQHGVSIAGPGPGGDNVNHHNLVMNNHIHHCGRLVGHGYGVRISQSGNNRILHNDIHHMPRYGTTIKGLRYQVLRESLSNVTWENHYRFLTSQDNLIAYNHIHHVNLDSQDTGAMESWGPGPNNTYDHNLIHDVGNAQFGLQSGIYLDDATDHFTVTNNIIYNVVGAGGDQCIFAKGIGNRIENNILVVSRGNVAAIRNMEMGGERGDNHRYLRNILYFEEPDADVYGFVNWAEDRVNESDYNLFWKPDGTLTISGGPAEGDFSNWLSLHGGRYDQHSIIADPMFSDADGNDYTLEPGSPAFDLGFVGIDTSEIGLTGDFPERLRVDEIYPTPVCSPLETTALPSEVAQGRDTTLTVDVECEAEESPDVRVDLAPLGGGYPQMYDDGTHGDSKAGDGVFSLRISTPMETALGEYRMGVSVKAEGMRTTVSILVEVLPGSDHPIYLEGMDPAWRAEFSGSVEGDLSSSDGPFTGSYCQHVRLQRGGSVRYTYSSASGLPTKGFASLSLELKPLGADPSKLLLQVSGGKGSSALGLDQLAPDLSMGVWNHLEIPLVDLGLAGYLKSLRFVSLGQAEIQIDEMRIRSDVGEACLLAFAPVLCLLIAGLRERGT